MPNPPFPILRRSVKSLTFPKFMILMIILLINSNDKMSINSLIKSMVKNSKIFFFLYIDQNCLYSYWKYVLSLSIFFLFIPTKILFLFFRPNLLLNLINFLNFQIITKALGKLRFRWKAFQFYIHNHSKCNFKRPRSVSYLA